MPNGEVPDDQAPEDPHGPPPGVAPQAGMRNGAMPGPYAGLTPEQQQQMVYQQYIQQQQHGGVGQYSMPPQV